MEEVEQIQGIKRRLTSMIPKELFTEEQGLIVQWLIRNAVDETIDMLCNLVFIKHDEQSTV